MLYQSGVEHISNTHLLAHLLRDYTTANNVMAHFSDIATIAKASVSELCQVKGVGLATAETITVAFELSRRLSPVRNGHKPQVTHPKEIYRLLNAELSHLKQEVLKVLVLDTKNRVEHIQTVFVGTLNCSITHPREIFKLAIRHSAASIILCHNHPSGVRSKGALNQ